MPPAKRFHCLLLLTSILLTALCSLPAWADAASRVEEYTQRREVRIKYSWLMRSLVEAKSAVKPLNELYAAVLFGSPDFAKSVVEGGLAGAGIEAGKKTLFRLTKELLEHPSVAARRIADGEYARGLAAYRRNYRLVKQMRGGGRLGDDEAKRFMEDEKKVARMVAANQLIRDINSREYNDWEDPTLKGAESAAKVALERVAELKDAAGELTIAELAAELHKVVKDSGVSLEGYQPYAHYKAQIANISDMWKPSAEAREEEMVVQPPSRPQPIPESTPEPQPEPTPQPSVETRDESRACYTRLDESCFEPVKSEGRDKKTGLWKEIRHKKSGIALRLVPAGDFKMGSNIPLKELARKYGDRADRSQDEFPLHTVKIKRPFYMGKYEVTQKEWKSVVKNNPASFKGDELPVENIRRKDAVWFCLKAGGGLRFPTEAQWEYACRAGTKTPWSFGEEGEKLDGYAWHWINGERRTHEVGSKKPNAWGLYDMHGNVWEWCRDAYHPNYKGAPADGGMWSSGDAARYILRGGAWSVGAEQARSANRIGADPERTNATVGFRVALPVILPDLLIMSFDAPCRISMNAMANMHVIVRSEKFEPGRQVKVVLQRRDLDAPFEKQQWKDIQVRGLTLLPPEEGKTTRDMKVWFRFTPDRWDRRLQFRAKVKPLPIEMNTDNNVSRAHRLDVGYRRIRVLYVEGLPRWEYRFLKNVLLRKKDELVVQCLLLSADCEFPQEHTQGRYIDADGRERPIKPLIKFPTREELKKFDVIIWGDVAPACNRYNIRPGTLKTVREFIETGLAPKDKPIGGGGLICILGPNHFPRDYARGKDGWELGRILPFTITEPTTESYMDRTESFNFRLTERGKKSNIFRFKSDPEKNENFWAGYKDDNDYCLSGSFWFWQIKEDPARKQGATVYVRHEKNRPEKAKEGDPAYALFFEKSCGWGTVFVSAIDDTWRWRYATGDKPFFAPFWLRVIKRAARYRISSEIFYSIDTDRDFYSKDGKVDIRIGAKVLGKNSRPIDAREITVHYRRRGGETSDLTLKRVHDGDEFYRGAVPVRDLEHGEYEIWIDESVTPLSKRRLNNFFTVE